MLTRNQKLGVLLVMGFCIALGGVALSLSATYLAANVMEFHETLTSGTGLVIIDERKQLLFRALGLIMTAGGLSMMGVAFAKEERCPTRVRF